MKILFEGYQYPNQKARSLLPSEYFDSNSELPKPRVVGYHYSVEANTPVIILPKVFLDENDVFFMDQIRPELFLQDNYLSSIEKSNSQSKVADFLFECSSWFYFSIKKYHEKYRDSVSLYQDKVNIIDCSHNQIFHTELDIILSLIKFNKDNKDLILLIKKVSNSQNDKIDWNRTIRKATPLIDISGTPIYFQTLSKKKRIDVDEDLIVLFLTLLNEIGGKYNINIPLSPYYNLLSQKEFHKIKRRGTHYLRSIRYKYFDDRLLTLYYLLYSYFERSNSSKIKNNQKEFLIIKDYNLVFQDMIDELLSDSQIPKKLKQHKDGKELDHIYRHKSFFAEDDIYFIGDSKYYKRGNLIEDKSIYKQFTYAKNVIQYNIDLFNKEGEYPLGVRYRDELSEGYNITPNFFIRGVVKNLNKTSPELTIDEHQNSSKQTNTHFPNRVFDRDTLIVQSYSINFIYVMWSYISSSKSETTQFKDIAKRKFYTSLLEYIKSNYAFYSIKPEIPVKDFIIQNFYLLNGRIYRPTSFANNNSFILGLKRDITAQEYLTDSLLEQCTIEDYVLE